MARQGRRAAGRWVQMQNVKEPTPTWAREIDGYLTWLRSAGRSQATVDARRQQLRMLARWAGRRSPWGLGTDDLVEWTASRDWAQERRRSVRSTLQGFYRWAVESGRAEHDPAAALLVVKAAVPRPRPCDEGVLRDAVKAAKPRDVLMMRLAAECGMRRAEVAQVHTRDVIAGTSRGEYSLIVHGKGNKERIVPLPPMLARQLLARPKGFVFPGRIDGHLSARWVGRVVGGWLDQGYTMHTLRHWFATVTYEDTLDLLGLAETLGHASPETTRRYIRLGDARGRAIVTSASSRLQALEVEPQASRGDMPLTGQGDTGAGAVAAG